MSKIKTYGIGFLIAVILITIGIIKYDSGKNWALNKLYSYIEQRNEDSLKEYKKNVEETAKLAKEESKKRKESDKKISQILKKQEELQDEINKNKPPETSEDLRARLRKLNVHPLN